MAHQKLFLGMIGLLVVGIGGVFMLLHQGSQQNQNAQIAKTDLIAGVAVNKAAEGVELENKENKEQAQETASSTQPKNTEPQKAAKQTISSSDTVQPSFPDEELIAQESQELPQETALEPESAPIPNPVEEPAPAPQPVGKIDINTANSSDLQQLSGVGPVLASRIIDYRKQVRLFYAIEDIKNVSGIGDAIFNKIKDNITVGNVSPVPQPAPLPPAPAPNPTPIPAPSPVPSPEPLPFPEKININTASYEQLQEITGVGEVIAQRIIDYRQSNGVFGAIEEIKNVKGIGDATFAKMEDEITI